MSNESKPSGSERLAQVLGEVDMDELEKAQYLTKHPRLAVSAA